MVSPSSSFPSSLTNALSYGLRFNELQICDQGSQGLECHGRVTLSPSQHLPITGYHPIAVFQLLQMLCKGPDSTKSTAPSSNFGNCTRLALQIFGAPCCAENMSGTSRWSCWERTCPFFQKLQNSHRERWVKNVLLFCKYDIKQYVWLTRGKTLNMPWLSELCLSTLVNLDQCFWAGSLRSSVPPVSDYTNVCLESEMLLAVVSFFWHIDSLSYTYATAI